MSLIEVLVSVVLLGLAGVAVLVALGATIRGADTHQNVSDAQSHLASSADALTDVPGQADDNYLDCLSHSDATIEAAYQAFVDAIPGSSGVTVVDVEYWDRALGGGGGFSSSCGADARDRLQRITLGAEADGVDDTIVVVKRPAQDQTIELEAPPTTMGGGNFVPELNPDWVGP
jgi:type II secretory pathway pseudopilin PulG